MTANIGNFLEAFKDQLLGEEKFKEKIIEVVWPSVLAQIAKSNIRNYSIALYERDNGEVLLFSYFEYVGSDYAADMKKIVDDPETQRWWGLTAPLQERLPEAEEGEWWHELPEVFHAD
jgi:L-rhamnose mutarotase